MAVYSPEFLAAARHGYENTDQPMRELARELGIGITTLSTLAEKNGWAKRSQRRRGLPPALQVLEQARALALSAHSREPVYAKASTDSCLSPPKRSEGGSGNPALADQMQPAKELGPRLRGDERDFAAPASEPVTTAGLIERMEQLLAQLIAAEEAAPANGIRSPQGARTLATLSHALRTLTALRGGAPQPNTVEDDDDDMPEDIDEFRRDLARRINAFVASRTGGGHAGGDSGAAPVAPV